MEDRTALEDVFRTRKIFYKESQQPKSLSAGEEETMPKSGEQWFQAPAA